MILSLALSLCVAASVEVPWRTNVHSEVRARSVVPNDTSLVAAGDVELTPTGEIGLRASGFNSLLSYTPTFRVREPYLSPRPETAHKANIYAEYRRDGRPRPFLNSYFSYGLTDFSQMQRFQGTAVPITPVRQFGLVRELVLDASGGVEVLLTPHLSFVNTLGYTWGGGADEESRKTLPVQRSPRLISHLGWQATSNDLLGVQLTGKYGWFSSGPRTSTLEALGSWAHQFDRTTSVSALVSVTGAYGITPAVAPADDPTGVYVRESNGLLPGAGVSGTHRFGFPSQHFDVSAGVAVSPFTDPFLGTVYARLEGSVGLAWSYGQHWSASARGGLAQSLAGSSVFTTYSEAVLGYEGARWWRVDGSGRLSTTATAPAAGAVASGPLLQWLVSVGVTLKTEGVL